MDQSFSTSFTVRQSAAEAFTAITDPRRWWSETIVGGTAQVGDEFLYEVQGIHRSRIRVAESLPSRRVIWRVLENEISFVADQTEWVGTEMRFDIIERDVETTVHFLHDGLVPAYECYDICVGAWSTYIGGSLRKLIQSGIGDPNQERTLVGDVVGLKTREEITQAIHDYQASGAGR